MGCNLMDFDGTGKKVNYDIHGRTKAKEIAKVVIRPSSKSHADYLLHEMTHPTFAFNVTSPSDDPSVQF